MRLDEQRENVSDETEIVGDGAFIAYAEVSYGPFTIEFRRGRTSGEHLMARDAQIVYKGPYIGADGVYSESIELPVNDTTLERLNEHVGTWDYIELADNETFDLSGESPDSVESESRTRPDDPTKGEDT